MADASYAADVEALVDETAHQIRGIAHRPVAIPAGTIAVPEDATLCSLWPVAKAILQALLNVVGGWLKIMIKVLIAAGDAACSGQGKAKA